MRDMVPKDVINRAEEVTQAVRKVESGFMSKPGAGRTYSYGEKHAIYDPESFAEYYGNDIL